VGYHISLDVRVGHKAPVGCTKYIDVTGHEALMECVITLDVTGRHEALVECKMY
jgi:hypothetical protein